MKRNVLLLASLLIIGKFGSCLQNDSLKVANEPRFSIDTSPISPLINIYGVHFNYMISPNNELITGVSYMHIHKKEGYTNSPALIVGYRRYIWEKLHVEYELWPCYDDYYETTEKKYYSGFDLWNEFRVGYKFEFKVKKTNVYVNLQWPFGFGLYSSNKPESFKAEERKERFFYHFPLVFVGIRF